MSYKPAGKAWDISHPVCPLWICAQVLTNIWPPISSKRHLPRPNRHKRHRLTPPSSPPPERVENFHPTLEDWTQHRGSDQGEGKRKKRKFPKPSDLGIPFPMEPPGEAHWASPHPREPQTTRSSEHRRRREKQRRNGERLKGATEQPLVGGRGWH